MPRCKMAFALLMIAACAACGGHKSERSSERVGTPGPQSPGPGPQSPGPGPQSPGPGPSPHPAPPQTDPGSGSDIAFTDDKVGEMIDGHCGNCHAQYSLKEASTSGMHGTPVAAASGTQIGPGVVIDGGGATGDLYSRMKAEPSSILGIFKGRGMPRATCVSDGDLALLAAWVKNGCLHTKSDAKDAAFEPCKLAAGDDVLTRATNACGGGGGNVPSAAANVPQAL